MTRATISKTFCVEAAHALVNLPSTHKCAALHGHSYIVELVVTGEIDPKFGWTRDFAELSEVAKPLIARLDHSNLNDVFSGSGWANRPTTAENLAAWLLDRLPSWVTAVRVRETATSLVEVERP